MLTGSRLGNFFIGFTSSNQVRGSLADNNPVYCAEVRSTFSKGERRSVNCTGVGYFLFIQLDANDVLTLCEVEVYGKRT